MAGPLSQSVAVLVFFYLIFSKLVRPKGCPLCGVGASGIFFMEEFAAINF
jgi:hypothetical protein